jgi:hypothetical protein
LSKLLGLGERTFETLRVQRIDEANGTIEIATADTPERVWQVPTHLQKSRVLAVASLQAVRQIDPALVAANAPCDAATEPVAEELSQLAWRERSLAPVRMLALEGAAAEQPSHTLIAEAGVEAAATQAGGSLLHV